MTSANCGRCGAPQAARLRRHLIHGGFSLENLTGYSRERSLSQNRVSGRDDIFPHPWTLVFGIPSLVRTLLGANTLSSESSLRIIVLGLGYLAYTGVQESKSYSVTLKELNTDG